MRLVLGIVFGLVIAFALVFVTDALFRFLVPTAARPDDPAALRDYAMRQPPAALVGIVAGWTLAVLVGAAAACRIARGSPAAGWAVTGLFLLATAANFLMIPHPAWMVVLAIVLILAGGVAAVRWFAGSPQPTA